MYLFDGFKFYIHIDMRWEYLNKNDYRAVDFFVVVVDKIACGERLVIVQRLIRFVTIGNFRIQIDFCAYFIYLVLQL